MVQDGAMSMVQDVAMSMVQDGAIGMVQDRALQHTVLKYKGTTRGEINITYVLF